MDSKSPEELEPSSIYLASNVWIRPDGEEPTPWEAAEFVPGDLRVQFADASIDKRVVTRTLNKRQQEELTAYLHFLTHGAEVKLTTISEDVSGGSAAARKASRGREA